MHVHLTISPQCKLVWIVCWYLEFYVYHVARRGYCGFTGSGRLITLWVKTDVVNAYTNQAVASLACIIDVHDCGLCGRSA